MTESGSVMPWTGRHGLSLANVDASLQRFQQAFLRGFRLSLENGVCSPVSACVLLAMLEAAADGSTRAVLRAALGIPSGEPDAPRLLGTAVRVLFEASGSDELESANTAWVARGLAPRAEFVAAIQRDYRATIMTLDSSQPAEAGRAMHVWAARQTRGRLPCMPPPVTPETLLVLMNTLWFKGRWMTPFDPSLTATAPFTLEDEDCSQVPVPMMSCVAPLSYREERTFIAVLLPYVSRLFMVIVLPRWSPTQRRSVGDLERALANETPEAWVPVTEYENVTVFLPRFRVSWSGSLVDACRAVGLGNLFTAGRADFSRGFGPTPLFVSDIRQEAMVDVNEAGTEAAALTSATECLCPPPLTRPVTFRADHPFLFFIMRAHTVLFAGRVMRPAET